MLPLVNIHTMLAILLSLAHCEFESMDDSSPMLSIAVSNVAIVIATVLVCDTC